MGGPVCYLKINSFDEFNRRSVQIRQKAIEVVLAIVSGAYKTSLLSYFMHRDFFPSLMKVDL